MSNEVKKVEQELSGAEVAKAGPDLRQKATVLLGMFVLLLVGAYSLVGGRDGEPPARRLAGPRTENPIDLDQLESGGSKKRSALPESYAPPRRNFQPPRRNFQTATESRSRRRRPAAPPTSTQPLRPPSMVPSGSGSGVKNRPRSSVSPEVERARLLAFFRRPGRSISVRRGTVMPVQLETDIDSRSPQSTVEGRLIFPLLDIYGNEVLGAQTKVFGNVVAVPELGSDRFAVLWDEAIEPISRGGRSLRFEFPGTGADGVRGVKAEVSHNWASFYGHAALLSLVGALAQAGQEVEGGTARLEAYAIQDFSRRGQQVTDRVLQQLERRKPRFHVSRGSMMGISVPETFVIHEDGSGR